MAFLIGMSETIKGQKFDLKKGRTTIGRDKDNDITLSDGAVSSQHCYISHLGNRYILHDLNSTNGTRLNSERITEAGLKPKQVMQIGSLELMFDADSSEFPELTTAIIPPVVVDEAASVTTPKSFSSVSPFGRRREENKVVWLTVIIVVGLLALIGLVLFVSKVF